MRTEEKQHHDPVIRRPKRDLLFFDKDVTFAHHFERKEQ